MVQRCKICERMRIFEGEGNNIKENWYCCWNCVQNAFYKGLITKQDLQNRDFDDKNKFDRKVERDWKDKFRKAGFPSEWINQDDEDLNNEVLKCQ